MSERFEVVPFHNHKILTVCQGDQISVPIKPLVSAMGLAWEAQRQRILRDPVLSKGTCILQVPSGGGLQDMLCMPLDRIPGFIATIPTGHIRNAVVKESVILFQEEAYAVLFAHFFGGRKNTLSPPPPVRDIIGLLDAIKKERAPAARSLLYDLLDQRCKASNVDTPPLDALGAASPENDIADAFFAALLELQNRGGEFSLHRNPAFLGVSLPSLRPLMNGAGIDCPPDKQLWKALRQHPAYEYSGNINCKDGKIRRCWVFRRADLFGFEPYPTTSNQGA